MANVPRSGWRVYRLVWAMGIFLLGFVGLIWLVSERFLIPAMAASVDAAPDQKRLIVATSRLLLAVVLFILCVGILLIFRTRRFFLVRGSDSRQKTSYIDAWAEAGKRRKATPEKDEGENNAE